MPISIDDEPTVDGNGAVPAPTGETMACWDDDGDAQEACWLASLQGVLP